MLENEIKNNENVSIELNVEDIDTCKKKENINIIISKDKNELEQIKPIIKKSDFEQYIINAYMSLQSQEKGIEIRINECYNNLEKALYNIQNNQSIQINKNIIDKLKRICKHQKLNLLMIIGKIYIVLLHKENLFNPNSYDDILLITFLNEVINLHEMLKETSLNLKFERGSVFFFKKIIDNFKLLEEQKEVIEEIILNNKNKHIKTKVDTDSFDDMIHTLYDNLINQENLFEQYNVIIDNKDNILGCIVNSDINENNNYESYLDLGKILLIFFFNELFIINTELNSKGNYQTKKILFNGEEKEQKTLEFIDSIKFKIYFDEDIDNCRKEIIQLIMRYVEKYKKINNIEFQHITYSLLKIIYLYYYDYKDKKNKLKFDDFFSEILINICSFQKEQEIVEIPKHFMKYILKSKKEEDSNLKEQISKKINLLKSNPSYDFETVYISNSIPKYEILEIDDVDIKIGLFNKKEIYAGEKFTFYAELEKLFSILEITWMIEEYDINFSIINVIDNKEILKMENISVFESPVKIILFFTYPGIFKITFDNTYSWINSKIIKYKYNIFIPESPYSLSRKRIIGQLKKLINDTEDLENYNEHLNKIFFIKFDDKNRAFNIGNVINNLFKIKKLKNEKKISSFRLYIDKNNLKFYDKNLISYDLSQENFEEYIEKLDIDYDNINIINLMSLNNENIQINNIQEILGFIPDFKFDKSNIIEKIIFFSFNISTACILFDFYNQKLNNEQIYDIVIHINYMNVNGYQISIYQDYEILNNTINLQCDKNDNNIEINSDIISKYINDSKNKSFNIILSSNDNTSKKLGQILEEKISNEQKENCKIIISDENYLDKLNDISQILFIDE